MTKPDIETRLEIELLVNSFYEKVKQDQVIGYLFNEVARVQWEKHLPKMYDFWDTILFYNQKYSGNPMQEHKFLHQKSPLKTIHFERWVALFEETVDELFAGEQAKTIKIRAANIARIMKITICES